MIVNDDNDGDDDDDEQQLNNNLNKNFARRECMISAYVVANGE